MKFGELFDGEWKPGFFIVMEFKTEHALSSWEALS